jgi:hypothetical protein
VTVKPFEDSALAIYVRGGAERRELEEQRSMDLSINAINDVLKHSNIVQRPRTPYPRDYLSSAFSILYYMSA